MISFLLRNVNVQLFRRYCSVLSDGSVQFETAKVFNSTAVFIKNFDDLKDVFKMMVGEMLENGLDGELDDELGYTKYDYRNKEGENSRNGYSKKALKTSFGETDIKVPRERNGEFEPQLVKKNQTTLTGDVEEKIISMYAKGMTTNDIEAHIKDIYGLECSDTTISRITDKILPVVREWQSRPLEEIYTVGQSLILCKPQIWLQNDNII